MGRGRERLFIFSIITTTKPQSHQHLNQILSFELHVPATVKSYNTTFKLLFTGLGSVTLAGDTSGDNDLKLYF